MLHARAYAAGHRAGSAGDEPMSATNPIVSTKKKSNAGEKPALAPHALAALRNAGLSRRVFLQGAGALIVSFSIRGVVGTALAQGRGPLDPTVPNPSQLDSWLAIGSDGRVTAHTGKVELG